MNFTEEQLQIIHHRHGHARVSAVAGSGKTTTMIGRIDYLLQQGVEPDKILVLMFNRSARDSFEESMRSRLSKQHQIFPEIRTFHSLGLRLVKSFVKRGALPPYNLVTEEVIVERLAKQVASETYRQDSESEGYLSNEDVEEFLAFIDHVKAGIAEPQEVLAGLELSTRVSFFPKAFTLFEEMRQKQRLRFFSDLIYEPVRALLADDNLVSWVENRVDHIIVDEYQDINETQQVLLKVIAGNRAEVMVVGDVDQCIYEWRGARPEYITTHFAEDFKNPAFYQLSNTFRFGHTLSLAANHLISHNKKRDRKLCVSHESSSCSAVETIEQKAKHPIVDIITKWLDTGKSLEEAVVLVRLYGQTVPVELALLEADIPYRLEGSGNVFECPEILALTGYLKVCLGTLESESSDSLKTLLHTMFSQPHLGVKREELESLAGEVGLDVAVAPSILTTWCGNQHPEFIKKRFEEAADNFRWLAKQRERAEKSQASVLLRELVSRFKLYDFYHNFATRSVTAENRVKSCEALIDFASNHGLTSLALLEKLEAFREGKNKQQTESLLLTSIHRSKGLEWPLVILPGLEEGSFPFYKESEPNSDLEDERRLFYVAITRCIVKVICIHPPDALLKKAMAAGRGVVPASNLRASRFLYEANLGVSSTLGEQLGKRVLDKNDISPLVAEEVIIGRKYLDKIGVQFPLKEAQSKKKAKVTSLMRTPEDSPQNRVSKILAMSDVKENMPVFHSAFGTGVIKEIKDRKQGRITVSFDEHGDMILLIRYAKLEYVQ